jgi:predicted aspartyl protease
VPETLRLFLIGIIFAIALCKGIQFLFVSILLPASAMILRWLYKRMNFFCFLSISLLYEFRNIGSSWQKQNRKMSPNHTLRNTRPARRTSTNQSQLLPPRVDVSQKTKRGLRGFANGYSTAGIADTGAAQNVVSLTFVQSLGLEIKPSTHKFRLGSSKQIMSLGNSFLQPIAPPKPH